VHSPLETFVGLLDRSVEEIAALVADARAIDLARIRLIADIWDNNTSPLISAACAPPPEQAERARAGLLWLADLGATRRELVTNLAPTLDAVLPAARPAPAAYRDYPGRVRPGSFSVTAETVTRLEADYDLPAASVRFLIVRPAHPGLFASVTLAAPRQFTPSIGRVGRDGSRKPWGPALLTFAFTGVSELAFDADDRTGAAVTSDGTITSLAIGRSGYMRAASATVHVDDPMWHESAAGQAADAVTPHAREARCAPVPTSDLSDRERAAATALHHLMIRIRLVGYHPRLAGGIPVRELCEATAGAGEAILRAGARRGLARRAAFAGLEQRWWHVPPDTAPPPVPAAPASLRYASYREPHEQYNTNRPGQATLVAATPDADPAAPWWLASEEITHLTRFRITGASFDGVCDVHRDQGQLALGDSLVIQ
jgi:hypothetical protein